MMSYFWDNKIDKVHRIKFLKKDSKEEFMDYITKLMIGNYWSINDSPKMMIKSIFLAIDILSFSQWADDWFWRWLTAVGNHINY